MALDKQPFHFRIVKARVAETLIKELFKMNGYNVFNFGMEEVMPGIVGSLNKDDSEEASQIRQLPDFVVQDKANGSLHYVEVKYRHNGIFKRGDLPKDFKYANAIFVIVYKCGIGCISYEDLHKLDVMPLNQSFMLTDQHYFKLTNGSVKEFERYAKMLFEGVE